MPFPYAKFSSFLTHRKQFIQIREIELYKRARVQLHWKGIVLRDEVEGALVKTKNQQVARRGELLVAEIDAKVGGVGIVPQELDGAIVSSHYFLFEIDESKCLRSWLDWFIRSKGLADQFSARGSTNYAAIRPHHILNCGMPLPPIDEQRRIISRIQQLAAKIKEVHRLRHETLKETENIMTAKELKVWPHDDFTNARALHEVTTFLARGRHSGQGPSDHYLVKTQHVQLGRYVETKITLAPAESAKVKPESTVQPGDVLIACSAAGCLGRVALYQGPKRQISTDTHVAIARANPEVIDYEYLYFYLKGAQGQFQLRSREKGDWKREKVGFRLTELNVADMRRVPIQMHPLSEQKRIVAHLRGLQERIEAVKTLQSETAEELDALIPSILSRAFRGEL